MNLELTGKVALIAGGTRGIGWAIAQEFAEEGAKVSVCGRDADLVDKRVLSLKQLTIDAYGESLDIRSSGDINVWYQNTASQLGSIDFFIWCISAQSFEWRESVEIDILSCVESTSLIVPYLLHSKCPAIVGISSQAAVMAVPSYKAYSAVKASLNSYYSSLSRELAPKGIRVNLVSPSEVDFEGGFWDRMRKEDPDLVHRSLSRHPFKRFCRAKEVASAVVFLCSPRAGFIAGTNLFIDGASRDFIHT